MPKNPTVRSKPVNQTYKVFSFDTEFPHVYNKLLMDEEGRLLLASKDDAPEVFDLVVVLDWYAKASRYCGKSSGDLGDVCEMASAEIKRLRALCAERKES